MLIAGKPWQEIDNGLRPFRVSGLDWTAAGLFATAMDINMLESLGVEEENILLDDFGD